MDIHKQPEGFRKFTEDLIKRVSFKRFERVVTAYGTVSIESKEYFISERLKGQRVILYRDLDNDITAEDRSGNLYKATTIENQYNNMTLRRREKNEYDLSLDELAVIGKELRGTIKAEHYLSGNTDNIAHLPVRGTPAEISSPLDSPQLIQTSEDAWYKLMIEHKICKSALPDELVESFNYLFSLMIDNEGGIAPQKINEFSGIIKKAVLEESITEAL